MHTHPQHPTTQHPNYRSNDSTLKIGFFWKVYLCLRPHRRCRTSRLDPGERWHFEHGTALNAQIAARAKSDLAQTSYRLGNCDCAGSAKESDEHEVSPPRRNNTAKRRQCEERGQLHHPVARPRCFHLVIDAVCRPLGHGSVLDCANDCREYGPARASGDHL